LEAAPRVDPRLQAWYPRLLVRHISRLLYLRFAERSVMEFRAITPLGGICIWEPRRSPFAISPRNKAGTRIPCCSKNAPSHFDSHGKVAEPGDSATWDDSNLWIA
jgi:hypothetical protein